MTNYKDQFLFFNGILCYFCFKAIRTDIGIGSKHGFITYGPITFWGFILVGFVTAFWIEFDLFTGYLRLFVLFWRYLSTRWPCCLCLGTYGSCDTSLLYYLLSSIRLLQRLSWVTKSFKLTSLWHWLQGLVRAPHISSCLVNSQWAYIF